MPVQTFSNVGSEKRSWRTARRADDGFKRCMYRCTLAAISITLPIVAAAGVLVDPVYVAVVLS